MNFKPVLVAAALLLGSTAHAALSAHNTDDVLPNSPWKEQGQPDAGKFNPAGGHDLAEVPAVVVVPVAPARHRHHRTPAQALRAGGRAHAALRAGLLPAPCAGGSQLMR